MSRTRWLGRLAAWVFGVLALGWVAGSALPARAAGAADSSQATTKSSSAAKSSKSAKPASGTKSAAKTSPTAKTKTSSATKKSTSKPASSSASKSPPAAEKKATPAAPRFAPFPEFTVLNPGQLLALRFKLTRLGGADPANAVAICSVSGTLADPADFVPYRRPGYQYEPTGSMPYNFNIEPAQMGALVDSVGTLPQVARGAAETHGVLSFAMLETESGVARAFEAVLDLEDARQLMGRLLGALSDNISAVNSLRRFGCAGDLLPQDAPNAADSLVKVTLTGIKADKASAGEFLTEAVITNVSNHPIAGPLTLVVQINSDTRLLGADGQTCHVLPAGSPFVGLGVGPLDAGGTIRQALRFWNQSGNHFDVSVALVAGPGTR